MFRFASPEYFYALLLLPLFIALLIYIRKEYIKRLKRFGNIETLRLLMPDAAWGKIRDKFLLVALAFVFIVIALARPQTGSKLKEVDQKGVELMFVVDVSNSMLAEDFKPSRIERTKNAINSLLDKFTTDRVGMVVFAGKPFMQLPVTTDYVVAKNFIDYISPSMIQAQGTDIAAALRLAQSSFSADSEKSRAVILISDGEAHDGDALTVASEMGKEGIIVNAIGIGTPEGSPIVVGGQEFRDENGSIVVSKLNEELLKGIAISGNGAYVRATNQSLGLDEVVKEIRSMDQKNFATVVYDQYNELYQYFLGIALVLLLLEFFILERRNRIFSKIKLFKR
ncbi:MAG: VWA domain-containing protein [Rikenellaceae bacterium]